MRIVVTGAAGYIGSNLIASLMGEKEIDEVVAIDNESTSQEMNLFRLAECVKTADFKFTKMYNSAADVPEVMASIAGADVIVHCACITATDLCREDPIGSWQNNVECTRTLLEMASISGIKRFILVSCTGVYGDPLTTPLEEDSIVRPRNEYHVQKLAQEYYTLLQDRDFAIQGTIVRISSVFGVGFSTDRRSVIAKFILRALAGKALQIHGTGRQKRNFIHVSDVCDALKRLIFTGCDFSGEIFNIAGVDEIEIGALAGMISAQFGVPSENVPYRDNVEPMSQYSISIRKARKFFGFAPQKGLEEGVRELTEYLSSDKKAGENHTSAVHKAKY